MNTFKSLMNSRQTASAFELYSDWNAQAEKASKSSILLQALPINSMWLSVNGSRKMYIYFTMYITTFVSTPHMAVCIYFSVILFH